MEYKLMEIYNIVYNELQYKLENLSFDIKYTYIIFISNYYNIQISGDFIIDWEVIKQKILNEYLTINILEEQIVAGAKINDELSDNILDILENKSNSYKNNNTKKLIKSLEINITSKTTA